jgi:cell division protein FtsB
MGNEPFTWLQWFYLVLAILVSIFSFTYWVYKFSTWWQRRKRRFARQLKSRKEQEEKLVALREEHDELTFQCENLRQQLKSFGLMSRWLRHRSVAHRLHELEHRASRVDEEIIQLSELLESSRERPGRATSGKPPSR